MYATAYQKHVVEETSQQRDKGPVPTPQYPETVEELRSKAKNLHRVERIEGSSNVLQCNVTFRHGQCTPLTDPTRILALASELKSGL